jgi:amidophosphoribosyltransferase
MCGVIGIVSHGPVNQLLYDGLLCLQHRGQDAAGIMTADGAVFHMHKAKGMVLDIFRTRNMRDLLGAARHRPHALPHGGLGGERA